METHKETSFIPLKIRVGVTGHRYIGNEESIKDLVRITINNIYRKYCRWSC